jgi:hypothetical protein
MLYMYLCIYIYIYIFQITSPLALLNSINPPHQEVVVDNSSRAELGRRLTNCLAPVPRSKNQLVFLFFHLKVAYVLWLSAIYI